MQESAAQLVTMYNSLKAEEKAIPAQESSIPEDIREALDQILAARLVEQQVARWLPHLPYGGYVEPLFVYIVKSYQRFAFRKQIAMAAKGVGRISILAELFGSPKMAGTVKRCFAPARPDIQPGVGAH